MGFSYCLFCLVTADGAMGLAALAGMALLPMVQRFIRG